MTDTLRVDDGVAAGRTRRRERRHGALLRANRAAARGRPGRQRLPALPGRRCRAAAVHQARAFGLSLDDIRQLLEVRDGGLCPCGHADELLTGRLAQLDEHIARLQQLRGDIAALLDRDVATTSACRSALVPLSARPNDEEDDDGWM